MNRRLTASSGPVEAPGAAPQVEENIVAMFWMPVCLSPQDGKYRH